MALPAAMVLSGMPRNHFPDHLQSVFNQGSVLLKSPRSASAASSSSSSSTVVLDEPSSSASSVIGSPPESSSGSRASSSQTLEMAPSPGRNMRNVRNFVRMLSDDEFPIPDLFNRHRSNPDENGKTRVMYQKRNLLDLERNLRGNFPLQYAAIPRGVNNFFENRSQLSRLHGAQIPPYETFTCKRENCGFEEPIYD
ncbi:uncharacterized protein [Leptinotarsa decemlineata]|uniref:uncharacterized protein n=1 Tax=Leptinotarsa decemlineata TaxID=7539 RepID=UPI003D30C4C4